MITDIGILIITAGKNIYLNNFSKGIDMDSSFYLKSIAYTALYPNGRKARKSDCHRQTAAYVASPQAKDSDIIVMLGHVEDSPVDVLHSFVVNDQHQLVSDWFPNSKLVSFDPKTLNASYQGQSAEVKTYQPITVITIGKFRQNYINSVVEGIAVRFKDFVSTYKIH